MNKRKVLQILIWLCVSLVSLSLVFLFVKLFSTSTDGTRLDKYGLLIPLMSAVIPLLVFRLFLYNTNRLMPLISIVSIISLFVLLGLILNSYGISFLIDTIYGFFLSGSWYGWLILAALLIVGPYFIFHKRRSREKNE